MLNSLILGIVDKGAYFDKFSNPKQFLQKPVVSQSSVRTKRYHTEGDKINIKPTYRTISLLLATIFIFSEHYAACFLC